MLSSLLSSWLCLGRKDTFCEHRRDNRNELNDKNVADRQANVWAIRKADEEGDGTEEISSKTPLLGGGSLRKSPVGDVADCSQIHASGVYIGAVQGGGGECGTVW